ncbi:hypothetical protein MLD38_004771 [Melastoma candidum]|uniref:Uncharacterized protein n=1 Tax=Melastoma candidum TaxID=119954 RepID=A0ACB9S6N0_9MYRT|nr:hypothetical protein MLD38_004771 [Melastoma candidum]
MDSLPPPLLLQCVVFVTFLLRSPSTSQSLPFKSFKFGPFDSSYYTSFSVSGSSTISNGALQLTPDSANSHFSFSHRYGRILLPSPFKLFDSASGHVASFNSSFLINIFRLNSSEPRGEGLAFVIAPDLVIPLNSSGQYLGLTNATTDGSASNWIIAVEFDTFKEDFDPDDNHVGLNINSIVSDVTVSLADHGLELAPRGSKFFHVWVEYNGVEKVIKVYMVDEDAPNLTKDKPQYPIMSTGLDISHFASQYSYFGFSGSTGDAVELNCVLYWNLTIEELPGSNQGVNIILIAGIAVGGSMTAVVMFILLRYLHIKRAKNNDPRILDTLKSLPGTPREFMFSEIKKATNDFNESNKLGQGGYGVVYKGVLMKENSVIAVKKFSRDSMKGKDDFLAELTIINKLRHKHLVKLLGWCHKNGMLLLVYEYMPNGSLDNHLFCSPDRRPLGWNLRYKIVSGVASALHYLHDEFDQKVLHRDLKASNILLDSDFNARLGDFGLARAIDNEMTSYAEHEGVPGTIGYIAPECLHTGKASRESDVFGFGSIVLEVVCGQRPCAKVGPFSYLADWVWSLHRNGKILDAVDQRLCGEFEVEEAERLLLLGLACTHPSASERPKTQSIVQIISGSVPAPAVPPLKPAFVWPAMSLGTDTGDIMDVTPMSSLSTGSSLGTIHGMKC